MGELFSSLFYIHSGSRFWSDDSIGEKSVFVNVFFYLFQDRIDHCFFAQHRQNNVFVIFYEEITTGVRDGYGQRARHDSRDTIRE